MPHAHGAEPDVEVREGHAEEAHPGPPHVPAVEAARTAIRRLPHRVAGHAIEIAPDNVAEGVTAEAVAGEQHHVERQHQGADADAECVASGGRIGEPEREPYIVRQYDEKDQ